MEKKEKELDIKAEEQFFMEKDPQKSYLIEVESTENSWILLNVMKKDLWEEIKKLKKDEIIEWEEKNWRRKAEYNKGRVVLPDRWFKASLINAAKKSRMVPHYATSKRQTYTDYLYSIMLYNIGETYSEDDLEYFGEFVGAQGKNSDTKVWRVRPMMKKWKAKLKIIDPAGRMKRLELYALLRYAGMFNGIGDNRTNNFGWFIVKNIKELN